MWLEEMNGGGEGKKEMMQAVDMQNKTSLS